MPPDAAEEPGSRFRRVLLKLSGDCFRGGLAAGIDVGRTEAVAREIKAVTQAGVQLGVVVGAGNILRGEKVRDQGLGRSSADYMGMLATVLNGLALQDRLVMKQP